MSETKIEARALTYEMLKQAVAGHAAAIRCRSELQPAAGEGTKVFPPTHSEGAYATEQRRLPNHEQPVDCVLLDSVQSQANRMEDALQDAIDRGHIKMPLIIVEFGNEVADIQRVTSLQAPHRAADAILRDSLLDGKPFRQSEVGKAITDSSLANATALFQYCPHALVLGVWDSTGPKGGLGAKFARALVSEIVGIDFVRGKKTASRIDPIQTRKTAGPIYHRDTTKYPGIEWTLDSKEAVLENKKPMLFSRSSADTKSKPGEPSKANHGNYPPEVTDGGGTIRLAEHTAVLSLPQLRRLRFPLDGKIDPKYIRTVADLKHLAFTSNFGVRSDPFRGTAAFHAGGGREIGE